MLKPMLLVPAALLFGFCSAPVFAAPAPQAAPAAQKASTKTAEVPAHVKKLYEMDCALCHGANGNGKTDLATDMKLTLDDWTDPKSLATKSDAQLFKAIREGKDKMPPEAEGRAKNEDVHSLIVYIRSMAKDQTTAPAAPAGEPAAPAAPAPAPTAPTGR
jgi:mono/diheme cytochrome c family protein